MSVCSSTISCISSNCYDLLIEPYFQGAYNIKSAWNGTKAVVDAAGASQQVQISLEERVISVVVGTLLFVPVVNAVVMLILRQIAPEYLSPTAQSGPASPSTGSPNGAPLPVVDEPVVAEVAPTREELAQRKTQALARLTEIEGFGTNAANRFEPNAEILTFNLQTILQRYPATQRPLDLCNFFDWAGVSGQIRGEDKRAAFRYAVSNYNNGGNAQYDQVKDLLSRMCSYFSQRQAQVRGTPAEAELKEQFISVVDRVIDANNNCVDQMLSQLQGIALDVIAEGHTASRGGRRLERIKLRAGHELCKYRSNLLKEICVRQNPDQMVNGVRVRGETHMADLERMVMQRLAPILGMQGEIFDAGACYTTLVSNLDAKANDAMNAFIQEYKPLDYLANDLRVYHGDARKLRNDILLWTNEYYQTHEEVEGPADEAAAPAPIALNMCRRMSEDFDALPMNEGGNLTPAAVLFLLQATNLIRQVGAPTSGSSAAP